MAEALSSLKQAWVALRNMQAELDRLKRAHAEPIAILGIGCRFPGGVTDLASFWRLLSEGIDAVTEVPRARWNVDAWYDPDPGVPNKATSRWGGFVSDLEWFDPSFFAISPREAPSIDPQGRMLFEASWEALEHAGQKLEQLRGSETGVYMGLSSNDYLIRTMSSGAMLDGYALDSMHSVLVGRLSYWLGLKGAGLAVDTGCSSSLVAVHLACEALRRGECRLALAGGSNAVLSPVESVVLSRMGVLSPTGRCRSFAADADGFVRSEGCGVLVLKRLDDARRDGDPILALIRGSAVNQCGLSNGPTAPNGPAQEAVIRAALAQAGVTAAQVDYVECHSTGTLTGDLIEAEALGAALGEGRPPDRPLLLGSLKTNIGHTEAASGVAGIIKAVLALQNERIPKSLHFSEPNPDVAWAELPARVVAEAREWPRSRVPRRAGVSSFAMTGSNAHMVLEEAPEASSAPDLPGRSAELLVLSATSAGALSAQAARLRDHLLAHPVQGLQAVAFSLAMTRSAMAHRLAMVASSREALLGALEEAAAGRTPARAVRGRAGARESTKVVFVFPGHASRWGGMGRQLLAEEAAFRTKLEACDRAIRAEAGWSLLTELSANETASQLGRIDVAQPLLFAVQVALTALWRSWGVTPCAVVGCGMGEVAAAHVAGALSLEDAVAIVCRRSRLLRFGDQGQTEVVSHDPRMARQCDELMASLARVTPQPTAVPMCSTVTGAMVRGPELLAGYWADDSRETPRFAEAVQTLLESGHGLFVEMSPHPTLIPAVEEILRAGKREGAAVGSLRQAQDERSALMEALGALWVHGQEVAWERLFPSGGRRVPLPTYPWQRERYWIEMPVEGTEGVSRRAHAGGHPLLGEARPLSTQTSVYLWETTLERQRLPWLDDHRVQGAVVLPGAAYLEMALASGVEAFGEGAFSVTDVEISEALAFAGDMAATVQMVTTEEQPGRRRFQVASRMPGAGRASFRVHARGTLRWAERSEAPPRLDLAALRARLGAGVPAATIYAALTERGLDYGPAFQGLAELWRREAEALGRVRLPEAAGSAGGYRLHPALLDACLQVTVGLFMDSGESTPWVLLKVGSLRLLGRPSGELWCHARSVSHEPPAPNRRSADLLIVDSTGNAVAEVSGLVVQRLASGARRREEDDWFLALDWEPRMVPAPKVTAGRWMLLGEGEGLGVLLRVALEASGHAVVHVTGGDTSAVGLRALLEDAFRQRAPTAIVHLRSLDGVDEVDTDAVEAALVHGCDSVLATLQALPGMGYRDAPRLWLVTRGAQAVGRGDVSVTQAPLVGLGRVIAMEHAELRCIRVDLDPTRPAGEVDALLAELLADDLEEEVALRTDGRRVARLVHQPPATGRRERVEPAGDRSFRLEIDEPGVLDRLALRATERRAPGHGEVEIAVEAAGLNFLDVLLALGVMPSDLAGTSEGPLVLGGECTGRIVAIGEGIDDFAVGQPVIAVAVGWGACASHVTTSATLVLPRPPGLSAIEAAAMPLVYLTAWYALDKVARLQPRERVLIHAATGGVGLAAVQWAQHVGAEVYATVGSPEKRAYLHSLGVKYVSDSRTDQFVTDVRVWTGGEGVDVVVNSLSGELLEKSFDLLRDHGRFVELGKRDYYANNRLGLLPFLRNLSFSLVDLRTMMLKRPAHVRALFEELLGLIAARVFTPPSIAAFPITRALDAFRKMAQAQHIGKLVLTLEGREAEVRFPAESGVTVRADGSYLVTGGLGGLGLRVAGWLAERGAGHLVLVGRSGAASMEQRAAVAAIEAQGARVTVAKADVADRAQLEWVLRDVAVSGMPLSGVIHAAGLLDDGLLEQQTPARLRAVMAPKVQGALHLHSLTRNEPLDFFVLFASAAGLLGSPGQSTYAAASTFLDALAHHRRARGLPALCIDWGAFSEVGLAAAPGNRGARLAFRGMRSLTPAEGVFALERLFDSGCVQAGVVPLDVRQWVEFYPTAASSRMLSRLLTEQRMGRGKRAGDQQLLDRLATTEPGARAPLLRQILCTLVAEVLRMPDGQLDADAALTSLGMDSLMGLELRNRIEATLGVTLPATLLWTYPTVAALTEHLSGSNNFVGSGEVAPPPATGKADLAGEDVAQLDADAVLAMLDQELALKRNKKPKVMQ